MTGWPTRIWVRRALYKGAAVGVDQVHGSTDAAGRMAKEGGTIGGPMDTIGALTSMALQYGVPLELLVRKFAHQRL